MELALNQTVSKMRFPRLVPRLKPRLRPRNSNPSFCHFAVLRGLSRGLWSPIMSRVPSMAGVHVLVFENSFALQHILSLYYFNEMAIPLFSFILEVPYLLQNFKLGFGVLLFPLSAYTRYTHKNRIILKIQSSSPKQFRRQLNDRSHRNFFTNCNSFVSQL